MSDHHEIYSFLDSQGCECIEHPHGTRWTFFYAGTWWSEQISSPEDGNIVLNSIELEINADDN